MHLFGEEQGYLARVEESLRVLDVLSTELVPRHQALHIIVEFDDAAIVFDPKDEAVCLLLRLSIGITGDGRKFGLHQSFLQGQQQLLGFRVTKQDLGTIPAIIKPLNNGWSH